MLTRPQNGSDPHDRLGELVKLLRPSRLDGLEVIEDWGRLLETARECRLVAPLKHVLENAPDHAPESVLATVSEWGTQRTLAAVYQVQQLHAVLDLLDSQQIPALAYKGLALAQLAFDSVGARETIDLDLLVAPHDFAPAYHALLRDGYECHYPRPTRHMFRQSYEISLVHPVRGVNVDLHRAFLPGCYLFSLTRTAVSPYSIKLLGREVATLEPTEHLLVLCAHGSKHGWRELRWIYDLHVLCGRHRIDWERLQSLACRHRVQTPVRVGLALSRHLFGTAIPDIPVAPALLEQTLRHLGDEEHAGLSQHRYQWRVADGWSARLRYMLWTLFAPHQRDLDFVDLPLWLWSLYYLVRPFRIAYERFAGRLPRPG